MMHARTIGKQAGQAGQAGQGRAGQGHLSNLPRVTTNRERTINMEVRAAMATSAYTKML